MRTMIIVHFGQKASAWGGATSEATRRNEVFCLLPRRQGGTRLFRASSTMKRPGPGKRNGNGDLARQELISNKI